jgi:hypothetical protein
MAANADKQQQHAWKMEAMQPQDEVTLACCRIWHEVLLSVIADLHNKKRQSGAYSYLCSKQFEEVALLLGINCDEARRRLVPASELAERMAKRIGPVKARTDEPDNTSVRRKTIATAAQEARAKAALKSTRPKVSITRLQDFMACKPELLEEAFASLWANLSLEQLETISHELLY